MLNKNKTELMVVAPKALPRLKTGDLLLDAHSQPHVPNLFVILDSTFSFQSHTKSTFYLLKKHLQVPAITLITSSLDYKALTIHHPTPIFTFIGTWFSPPFPMKSSSSPAKPFMSLCPSIRPPPALYTIQESDVFKHRSAHPSLHQLLVIVFSLAVLTLCNSQPSRNLHRCIYVPQKNLDNLAVHHSLWS